MFCFGFTFLKFNFTSLTFLLHFFFTSFVLHITDWFTFAKSIFPFWVVFELKLENTYSIRNFILFVDWVLPFLSYDKAIAIVLITRVKGYNSAVITSITAWIFGLGFLQDTGINTIPVCISHQLLLLMMFFKSSDITFFSFPISVINC